ncbi:transposase [Pseudonocardia sp. K10HN5]|uniref:Transposase n=1 Tax=Pseudonocardia acidicola TaxID=2724939 RepID=A0ABX1SB10_9PSEU|nr:transposase [Pseudonocardia acidicola]
MIFIRRGGTQAAAVDRGSAPGADRAVDPTPSCGPGGRPRIDDRAALEGILFVLHTGCRWRDLPPQLGCGSGHTAWRRLREWEAAGVWDRLHRRVLDELPEAELLDWSRACIDAVSVRAKRGAS